MPAQIEVDMVAALAAAGLGLTTGTNLFYGPMRDGDGDPDALVTVLLSGSYAFQPVYGGADAPDLKPLSVQVRVRSAIEDYTGGSTLAQAVVEALHKRETGSANVSWLVQSAPLFLGIDNKGRHGWSINILATRFE